MDRTEHTSQTKSTDNGTNHPPPPFEYTRQPPKGNYSTMIHSSHSPEWSSHICRQQWSTTQLSYSSGEHVLLCSFIAPFLKWVNKTEICVEEASGIFQLWVVTDVFVQYGECRPLDQLPAGMTDVSHEQCYKINSLYKVYHTEPKQGIELTGKHWWTGDEGWLGPGVHRSSALQNNIDESERKGRGREVLF